jgi:hypothetical protein
MTGALRLAGGEADAYLARALRLLAVARPGLLYPDARRVAATWGFLGPSGSRGAADSVELDPRSGLPSLSELARVRADQELAEEFLRDHGGELPERAAYYRALSTAALASLSSVDARLVSRRQDGLRFEVVHDLLDPTSGCLVRFTWHLRQSGPAHIALERKDLARPGEAFLTAVERCAGADVELGLLLLSDLDGLTVEEGVRGQIGPLQSSCVPPPPPLAGALEEGAFVLHLSLERAGAGVPADVSRDPFSPLYRDALSRPAREAVEARQQALGYRVSKERRLVTTPEAQAPIEAALHAAGHALVVRSR